MAIQMPHGSSRPLPSRTVRSSPLSQVIGASIRRSSARPFAAPRTSSMVPSVMMNGTTRRPVISTPFTSPHAAPAATARCGEDRPRTVAEKLRDHNGAQRDDRSHRQIDPPRDDDHRHAQRGNADDGGLARHQLQIGGAEELRADQESEEDRDEDARPREHSSV